MSWEGLQGNGITSSRSAVESERFHLPVGRVTVGYQAEEDNATAAELTHVLQTLPEDLLIVRWRAEHTRFGWAAMESGRRILPADTLTYWEVTAGGVGPGPRQAHDAHIECRRPDRANEADMSALGSIIDDSFRNYRNHYSANPLLDQHAAAVGYRDWALRSLRANPEDVVVVTQDGRPIGIATIELSSNGHDLEILLAGLTKDAQGQGLYGHLLAGVSDVATRRGAARIIISTQTHNVRVQRAWCKAGFRPFAAITTAHAMTRP